MAQVGEKVGSPLTLMREYLTALSGLLDGQTVTVKGRYVVLDDVALDWPPDTHVDLLAAATGPKTLRLSGELASGTVISGGTTPSALRDAVAHIRAGAALRDTSAPHSVTIYVPCATGPDARRRATADLDAGRRERPRRRVRNLCGDRRCGAAVGRRRCRHDRLSTTGRRGFRPVCVVHRLRGSRPSSLLTCVNVVAPKYAKSFRKN